ncbi:ATP-binding cassette domain-containing protein [bacterium]|nr:ATP-binding cassette domain-containing protein [bacterium]NCQ54834.1 ATP-binding cassette domain-containing protein [Candidatus Parcubacteria bacterium]NCS66878.1 ATP-binding cassette domain-containing protein [Candidatus Peregrinibacteria bacterium]NCS95824.1 ATP-binding cassette domain-containing protein [bacterium]
MLTFKNVSLKIGKSNVLSELDFSVKPGEIVAVLGASGAGKSSLFSLLIGEKKPSSGEILLDEISLGDLSFTSVQQYRRQIGIIFQDFRLLPQKTVFENIAFALEICGKANQVRNRVPELLKLVGLENKQDRFPRELSGGERQRVSIARSLAHNPKMLIADEATGNLDPKNSREISELLLYLNQKTNLTLLFATHDPVMVQKLNPRVIRLEAGRIRFDKQTCALSEAFADLL